MIRVLTLADHFAAREKVNGLMQQILQRGVLGPVGHVDGGGKKDGSSLTLE